MDDSVGSKEGLLPSHQDKSDIGEKSGAPSIKTDRADVAPDDLYKPGEWIPKADLDPKRMPAGCRWEAGRITRHRSTARPEGFPPEAWKSLSQKGRKEVIASYEKAEAEESKPVPAMPTTTEMPKHRSKEQTCPLTSWTAVARSGGQNEASIARSEESCPR